MEQLTPAEPSRLVNLGAVVSVRSSAPGILLGLSIINTQAAPIFVQIFDAATPGAVTLGTTVPTLEFNVLGNTPFVPPFVAGGMRFRTGLQMASTTAAGGPSPSANGVIVYPLIV